MAKQVKEKKPKPPKVFNNGTMTNAAFFGMIRATLRKASRYWKPIAKCKELARRKSKSSNKRLKWEFQCVECTKWFPEKEIAVDHKIECGSLKSFEDLSSFARKLFVEVDQLQILCKICHNIKTKEYLNNKKNV